LGKKQRHFDRVAEFKDRFRALPTHTLQSRLDTGILVKEAAIAIRELLEERKQGSQGPDSGGRHPA
jgi:hypothetical protein